MKTQGTQHITNVVTVQPSTINSNQKRVASRQLGGFGPGLLVRVLCLLLLAMAGVRAGAQNIYVSSFNGAATIGKYGPDGSVINANFVNATEADFVGLSVSGTTLVVADQEEFLNNDGVVEINTTTGVQLPLVIGMPRQFPRSAVIGSSDVFVLYGTYAGAGAVGEYLASNGTQVSSSICAGYASYGQQMAGWTDASGNVNLYITISQNGSGGPNTGSVLHITVTSSGPVCPSGTLVSGLNSPSGIAVSPDGQFVYVLSSGAISKYATGNGALQWTSATISGSPGSLAASAGVVFVARQSANAVGAYYAGTGATISATYITGVTNPQGIAVGPPACVHPPGNMTAWYTFDQTGSAQEDLANENTATAYNTTSIVGEVANALQFNGTSAYVQAPSQSSNNLGTGNFSIDAWVKVASSADDSGVVVLLDKRDASFGYHLFLYNGELGLQMDDSAGYSNYVSNIAVPADNAWHLVAVTVVRNSHTGGAWYLDGAPIGTFDPTAHPGSLNSTSPLDIGVRTAAQYGGGYFKGSMDEVEIFTRALSSAEVLSLMQAGPAGKCKCATPPASMMAWYAFDQTGSTQNDLALGNTATAYSTTSIVGEVANALQFNGSSSYAQAPSTPSNSLGTSDLSLDAWVKIASSSDDAGVVAITDKRDQYPNPLRGYHFFLYNGKIGIQLADSSGYANYISTTAVPADNQWHLIAVTVQRNSHTGGVWYLDGFPIDTPFDPTAHGGSVNSSASLNIGAVNGGGSYFKGGLDELEIFDRALSSYEVLGLMQAGPAGKCKL